MNRYRINLVQLRELRNDNALHSKLAPLVPLSAVRNRDRQDVDSIMEISRPDVRKILNDVKSVPHTVVPENKNGVFKAPTGTYMDPLGHFCQRCGTEQSIQGTGQSLSCNCDCGNGPFATACWSCCLQGHIVLCRV